MFQASLTLLSLNRYFRLTKTFYKTDVSFDTLFQFIYQYELIGAVGTC